MARLCAQLTLAFVAYILLGAATTPANGDLLREAPRLAGMDAQGLISNPARAVPARAVRLTGPWLRAKYRDLVVAYRKAGIDRAEEILVDWDERQLSEAIDSIGSLDTASRRLSRGRIHTRLARADRQGEARGHACALAEGYFGAGTLASER